MRSIRCSTWKWPSSRTCRALRSTWVQGVAKLPGQFQLFMLQGKVGKHGVIAHIGLPVVAGEWYRPADQSGAVRDGGGGDQQQEQKQQQKQKQQQQVATLGISVTGRLHHPTPPPLQHKNQQKEAPPKPPQQKQWHLHHKENIRQQKPLKITAPTTLTTYATTRKTTVPKKSTSKCTRWRTYKDPRYVWM